MSDRNDGSFDRLDGGVVEIGEPVGVGGVVGCLGERFIGGPAVDLAFASWYHLVAFEFVSHVAPFLWRQNRRGSAPLTRYDALGPRLVTRDLGLEVATVPGEVYGKAPSLIARIWRGWTRAEDTEAYAEYILATGIAEYESTPGNRGAYLISRPDGNRTEFLTVSFWDTEDSIVAFVGDNIDQAVFYPEDDRYLVDREITVRHFTVH